ncbi:hypothetical protein LZG71_30070, partial [Dyadobacter sp. CY312]
WKLTDSDTITVFRRILIAYVSFDQKAGRFIIELVGDFLANTYHFRKIASGVNLDRPVTRFFDR